MTLYIICCQIQTSHGLVTTGKRFKRKSAADKYAARMKSYGYTVHVTIN